MLPAEGKEWQRGVLEKRSPSVMFFFSLKEYFSKYFFLLRSLKIDISKYHIHIRKKKKRWCTLNFLKKETPYLLFFEHITYRKIIGCFIQEYFCWFKLTKWKREKSIQYYFSFYRKWIFISLKITYFYCQYLISFKC